jgi:hypothetical protein
MELGLSESNSQARWCSEMVCGAGGAELQLRLEGRGERRQSQGRRGGGDTIGEGEEGEPCGRHRNRSRAQLGNLLFGGPPRCLNQG